MSSVYILEPPTSGKVLLKTSFGDIEIELWSKEAPKACRNFVQLCMEGYYNNTPIHKIVTEKYAETGDPTGTGDTWECVYDSLFKDEIHSRLQFTRRGLVACKHFEPNKNGSQFLFTLGPLREFNRKRTIFGKVCGQTLYNMINLNTVIVDQNGKPEFEYKIMRTEILFNPFTDIIPRELKCKRQKKADEPEKEQAERVKAVKNFSLLSFGEEAIEGEMESNIANEALPSKSKSINNAVNDPMLSNVAPVAVTNQNNGGESNLSGDEPVQVQQQGDSDDLKRIREKLRVRIAKTLKERELNKKNKKDEATVSEDGKSKQIEIVGMADTAAETDPRTEDKDENEEQKL